MSYTDPSGEFWIPIVGMALINGIQSGARSGMNGGSFGKGFLIGAGVTAATMFGAHYAGFLNIPGMMPNGALHGGMNVGVNGVSNMIAGNKFTNGWALSAATGFAHGAYSGYHLSKQQGRNYWWGSKVHEGRTQWSFNPSELPENTVHFSGIDFTTATANNTCVPQSLAEVERAKGGLRTEADFRESTGWTPEGGVMMPVSEDGRSYYLKLQGFENESVSSNYIQNNIEVQNASLNNNNLIIIHKDDNIYHMTPVRKIEYYKSGKIRIHGRGRNYNFKKLNMNLDPNYFLIY